MRLFVERVPRDVSRILELETEVRPSCGRSTPPFTPQGRSAGKACLRWGAGMKINELTNTLIRCPAGSNKAAAGRDAKSILNVAAREMGLHFKAPDPNAGQTLPASRLHQRASSEKTNG
jgi:hypothetical protein